MTSIVAGMRLLLIAVDAYIHRVRPRIKPSSMNKIQGLVLSFFALAWVGLVLTLVVAPEVYAATLDVAASDSVPLLLFLAALSAFLALLSVGVVRRWRWTFWLILVAFAFGILRVPVAVLQLGGWIDQPGPRWYAGSQAILGVLQFGIGVAMLIGYRRGGTWAAF